MPPDLFVKLTVYRDRLVIEGPVAEDFSHPDWIPNGDGRIGCMLQDTAAHLGASEEAIAWLRRVPRSRDAIGGVMWFEAAGRFAFGWLGGPLCIANRDSDGDRDYAVRDGAYTPIPNDPPRDAVSAIDQNSSPDDIPQ